VIRAGVVGVGSMGRNHARVWSELSDVTLVGVADTDEVAREQVRKRFRVPVFGDLQQLLLECRPDVVSIAVPTHAHAAIASLAIAAGVHVLVEKPIASTKQEAKALIHEARARGVVFAVGHIERHNPAVVELKRRLDSGALGRVLYIEARRWSPYPERIGDVGVALDLATHDVDVMRFLTGSEVVSICGGRVIRVSGRNEDLVIAVLSFGNGVLGLIDSNRITPTKTRELTVLGEDGMARVDYLLQDLSMYQNGAGAAKETDWDSLRVFKGVSEGEMLKVGIERQEPLKLELEAFIRAVRGDTASVHMASGEDGLAALDVVLQVLEACAPVESIGGF